jgi:hypothetical protein
MKKSCSKILPFFNPSIQPSLTILFFFFILCTTSSSKGQTKNIDITVFVNDTIAKNKIDKLLALKNKKLNRTKEVTGDTVILYYYDKILKDILTVAVMINNCCNASFTRYNFLNGELKRVYFLQRNLKKLKPRPGGLYYFVNSRLVYSSEYNIPNQNPEIFLTEASRLKEKAAVAIK